MNTNYWILGDLINLIKSGKRKHDWHKLHPNSDIIPMNRFDFNHVKVSDTAYGELNVVDFGGNCQLILKNYVSIAQNVTFILNAEHSLDRISTYPFKVKILELQESESFGKGDIIVDDDVWIGYGATILSGVHIGQGAVVAAGTLVDKDVQPYAIVGGVPAKFIRYRFESSLIEKLLMVDYNKLTKENVQMNIASLNNVLEVEEQLEFLPKKYEV